MRNCPGQLRVRNPKLFLASLLLSSAHPHARILRTCVVNYTILFLGNPDLHHGLLEGEQHSGWTSTLHRPNPVVFANRMEADWPIASNNQGSWYDGVLEEMTQNWISFPVTFFVVRMPLPWF
jgi:hypothetical protein